MLRFRRFFLIFLIGFYLQGCASGPSFRAMEKKLPSLAADRGRIFFLQAAEYSGSRVELEVRLNGFYVGKSMPGGFFFVDRNAGKYMVHCSSDHVTFTLKAGETRYMELVPTIYGDNPLGVRIILINPVEGETMIKKLFYTGRVLP